ncbi:winged helix DNA-binding domain-containing protein [Rhizohabitans arisaemae]|uniref:winged helix DNA-binding domain-containing protein n=1 Tax=Rhizohabitans arisaemae TaxID=2720610 RepID=UPI0024B179D2|nr:winged helix DNA-binding domain-containing protein [Rhizohabitans arisaemae]
MGNSMKINASGAAGEKLSARAVNRATLARQLLLERAALPVVDAVEHLLGLQAQTTHTWYVGLWSRLAGLDPVAVGTLLESRELVRIPVMRATIHLLSAADALALRPVVQPMIDRAAMSTFGRHLGGVDRDALVDAAREITGERPRSAAELGRLLAYRFPGRDAAGLAQVARAWLPMVQVPPRGVWGRSGQALQSPLESWLGRAQRPLPLERLVLRHLAAFGPATVRDVQTWSGLTRLAEVFTALRPGLRVFTGPDGAELFDLPDAPRPGPDSPAPVRFLYDFDNLLLSYADRSRILGRPGDVDYTAHGYAIGSNQPATVLVDGMAAATWTVLHRRGSATLAVRAFRPLTPAEQAEIETEGAALLTFLHPGAAPDIRIG